MLVKNCECGDHAFVTTGTQAGVIMVDPGDACILHSLTWTAQRRRKTFYAIHPKTVSSDGKRKTSIVKLHQLIFGKFAEHKNRNGLDNRRCNLRSASNSQNSQNRRPKRGKKYLGVFTVKNGKTFLASIRKDYKKIHIGCFSNEEAAARAYDNFALKLFGPNAYLNFPPISPVIFPSEMPT